METFWQVLLVVFAVDKALCTISGLTYMDSLAQKHRTNSPNGEDPCNPLFWYPNKIPDHCYSKTSPRPPDKRPANTFPLPIPVPVAPPPIPMPMPLPAPIPAAPIPAPMPMPAPAPGLPGPMLAVPPMPAAVPVPIPPIPYGIPIAPTHPMLPVFPQPYPYPPQPFPAFPPFPTYPIPPIYHQGPPAGFVPGLPGLVSPDGGINILPFTDVYSEILEKHKQKMMKKQIEKMMEKYENYPKRRKPYRRHMYD
ncbi:uncharacterized protein LOC126380256 [Pectinophora gossypiella]|uniref:uncharacterized protein LOC126380256 n=1 Tax=Pectinophora gossypiella TaxID=13191 RepID=UPI00214E3D51|nr:uncharacterized protein LOC126380256 [Pectinophora gossypiella]